MKKKPRQAKLKAKESICGNITCFMCVFLYIHMRVSRSRRQSFDNKVKDFQLK